MGRLLGIETLDEETDTALRSVLREHDEAIALPNCCTSIETGVFKNCVFVLSSEGDASDTLKIFANSELFDGVSIVEVPYENIEHLETDAAARKTILDKLKDTIRAQPYENTPIGPSLQAAENGRDVKTWQHGLTSMNSFVGLFVTSHTGEFGIEGCARANNRAFLVCRASGGMASQELTSQLVDNIKKKRSFGEILGKAGLIGETALRRTASASTRNRARVLYDAAVAFNVKHKLQVSTDSAVLSGHVPIVCVDAMATLNAISETNKGYVFTSGCSSASTSTCAVTSSCATDGLFLAVNTLHPSGSIKLKVRNDAESALPFATRRLISTRAAIARASDFLRKQRASSSQQLSKEEQALKTLERHGVLSTKTTSIPKDAIHPDHTFVTSTFAWKNEQNQDMAPSALWGTHASNVQASNFSRHRTELGLENTHTLHLRPLVVLLAPLPLTKLRLASY